MLTLSSYIKALKKYANNISISDDEFFRALFGYITEALNIRNKNDKNEYYDFTKSRISGILTQKEDVPSAIRTAISHYSAKKKVLAVYPDFLDDYMNPSKIDALSKHKKSY
jgi:phage-related protein